MAMAPGTIDDLNHIKDLKEAKDTWKDAGDALYDSLEQMAKSVESMRDGINQVQSGVSSAESARQKWSANKDSILAGNDQTLESLTALSQQLETLVPHLQTAKDAAETVHNSMGDIVNTMGDMQEPLRKMYNRLRNISTTSQSLGEQLNDVREDMAWLIQNNAQFQVQTTTILEALPGLIEDLQDYDAEALDLYDEALNDTRSTVMIRMPVQRQAAAQMQQKKIRAAKLFLMPQIMFLIQGKIQQRQIAVRIQQMLQVVQMPQTQQMIQTAQMQQIPVIHRHSAGRILKNMMCLW